MVSNVEWKESEVLGKNKSFHVQEEERCHTHTKPPNQKPKQNQTKPTHAYFLKPPICYRRAIEWFGLERILQVFEGNYPAHSFSTEWYIHQIHVFPF